MLSDYTKSSTLMQSCDTTGHYVIPYPTGNCQLFCIGDAYNILDRKPNEVRSIFVESGIMTGRKTLCLIDVQKDYIEYVEQVFSKDEILIKDEYLSSNGSDMCIFIIKIPYIGYY